MKFSKKILAAVLAALMAISMMPFSAITAFAAKAADITGECGAEGDNATYLLEDTTSDGKYDKLTISGSGAIADYVQGTRPWASYNNEISTVVVNEGITEIGGWNFCSCSYLTSVTLPDTLRSIGKNAFSSNFKLESVNLPNNLETIGNGAFSSCPKFNRVTIPASVTTLADYCFNTTSNTFEYITFVRPNTAKQLTIGDSVFGFKDYGTKVAFTGEGAKLFNGDNEILAETSVYTYLNFYSATTLNWVAPTPTGVAEVNGTGYETLEEAIAAAQDGDTVTLLSDVSTNITVPAGKNITLDLNDHTINAALTNNGTLTVQNGTISHDGFYFDGFGSYSVMNNGTITLTDVNTAGAIVNRSASTVASPSMTISGGTHTASPFTFSGENNSTTAFNGGTFSGTFFAASAGSTVIINDGTVAPVIGENPGSTWIINGGSVHAIAITPETASDAINVTINGGTVNSLEANGSTNVTITGGAVNNISKQENATISISGGTFSSVVPEEYCADGYVPVTEPNADGKYEVVKKAREDGFNLSIEDKIHMNLYINVDDYTDPATATVTVTYNDPEKQTPTLKVDTYSGAALAALKDEDDGRYVIPVLAAPAQMRDNVSVTVTDRDDSITTSVAKYCETIIATSNDAKLVALAKAMLDYGKACSAEFNYNVDGFEEQAYYNAENVTSALDTAAIVDASRANDKFAGYAYIAKSIPALRIYLNTTEQEAVALGGKAVVNGAETQIMVDPNGDVCVDITGILAEDLNAEYTVEFNGGELKLNALQFAKAKGGNTDLGRSMYNYYTAADAYFV